QYAARRDRGRTKTGNLNQEQLVDPGASPSREVDARDLLHEVHRRLSPDERRLMDLRNQGHEWAGIADQLGCTADAARIKLSRALNRVSGQLGLDDVP